MFYIPIIGALAGGVGTTLQKFVLKHKRISPHLYQVLVFFMIFIIMIPLAFFFWRLDSGAFELRNIFIFVLIVLFSVAANALSHYAMKWDKISNLEPAKVLEPLFVILLAIVFSYLISGDLFEKNNRALIPALVAMGALIFSHVEKHHLKFNKYFIAAILGSFFYALELVLAKFILEYYSPITLYFLRCAFIFFLSLIIFRPKFRKLNAKIKWQIFAVAFIWVVYRVAIYYGYELLGVLSTTLVFMISPVLVYLFAHEFLKEKMNWRNIVASIIIVLCVLYSVYPI